MDQDENRLLDSLLRDAEARKKLARALADELEPAAARSRRRAILSFLGGLSSGLVVLLAFLLPSVQEQWNLFETRKAVDRYASVARELSARGNFEAAEQAYGRALELAGNQRADLMEAQLKARVLRVYENPAWRATNSKDITEPDFEYLLEADRGPDQRAERSTTLEAYGVFLASKDRLGEARTRLEEAIATDPKNADAHTHLGNVYDDLGQKDKAEAEYRRALSLSQKNARAHYNLGLLLASLQKGAESVQEFRAAVADAPDEPDLRQALIEALQQQGLSADAAAETARAAQAFPADERFKPMEPR